MTTQNEGDGQEQPQPQRPLPSFRRIDRSLHEALIRLIPIQAQKIRDKAVARWQKSVIGPVTEMKKRISIEELPKLPFSVEEKDEERIPTAFYDNVYARECENRAQACEARLLELLGQCSSQHVPSSDRIQACLQMIEEICIVCVPFAHVLKTILKELMLSIYGNAFDRDLEKPVQVPYFTLVRELESEGKKREQCLETWRTSLAGYESHIQQLEQNMESLKAQVKNAEFLNKNLHASIAVVSASLEKANDQVTESQDKLAELKQEVKDAKAEIRRSKDPKVHLQREDESRKQQKLKAEYEHKLNEIKHFRSFLDAAKKHIASCVPRQDYLDVKARMLELETKLINIKAKSTDLTFRTSHLTPRPVWEKGSGGVVDTTLSTLEQVAQICKQNAILSNKLSKLQTEWTNTNVALAEVTDKYEASKKPPKKKY